MAPPGGRWDARGCDQCTLRPLLAAVDVPATCADLWLRRSGADPWEFDVLLSDVADGTWRYRRAEEISGPLQDVLVEDAGIRYLRPEVSLLHEAPDPRPVDQADAEACIPLLTTAARTWLRVAPDIAHPGHPRIELTAAR